MQLGVIDLGPLGSSVVRRVVAGGHRCVVFDRSPRLVAELGADKAYGAASLEDLVNELDPPRAIWLAGPAVTTDATIADLLPHLEAEDIVVSCGDSYYVDDICRATDLARAGIHYIDVGVAGRLGCPDRGYCLTIGGEEPVVRYLEPLFRQLAPGPDHLALRERPVGTACQGYLHCGPAGAGHFVKMIHDVIERCLIAAYAEGLSILRRANVRRNEHGIECEPHHVIHPERYQYEFRLPEVAEVWRHGSLVASPVLDSVARMLARDATLSGISASVTQTREDWLALRAAADEAILTPVLASAMYLGSRSPDDGDFSTRLLAAHRQESSGGSSTGANSRRPTARQPQIHDGV